MPHQLSQEHRRDLARHLRGIARQVVFGVVIPLLGCTYWSGTPVDLAPRGPANLRLHLRDGQTVIVRNAVVRADSIVGLQAGNTPPGLQIAVARAEVDRVEIARIDGPRTAALVVGLVILGFVAVACLTLLAYANEPT